MNSTNAAPIPNRCQHRTRAGRQCRATIASPGSLFCAHHVAALSHDSVDFSADLIKEDDHFQAAQQINHSLIALYKLVASGRMAPRRASVLAYIAYLILNSLKAIDYDNHRQRRRPADPSLRPTIIPLADLAALRTEPLPETAEEFVAAVLERQST